MAILRYSGDDSIAIASDPESRVEGITFKPWLLAPWSATDMTMLRSWSCYYLAEGWRSLSTRVCNQ